MLSIKALSHFCFPSRGKRDTIRHLFPVSPNRKMETHHIASAATPSLCTWCQKPVAFYNTIRHARKCTGCKTTDLYCSSCTSGKCAGTVCLDHPTCWQNHVTPMPPHIRLGHQIANPFPSLFVEAVTHSESNKHTLKRLHEKDKLARWFSVTTEEENPELWLAI